MPFSQHVRTASIASLLALSSATATLGWAAPSAAQPSNTALAESLFREGKRLSAEKKFTEACPKFQESYRLDPGLGTLLNLATCHESEGKPASAWAEFSDASSQARREGDSDRGQLAEEHMKALEPKLAHVSVGLAPGAAVPGLVIKFDGRELSSAALGVQFPVDPGKHVLEASAPNKQSYAQTFAAPGTPTTLAVTIPVLQDGAPAAADLPPVTTTATPPPAVPAAGNSQTGLIASGIATGVLALGTGITAALYSSQRSDFNKANDAGDPSRNDQRDSAQTLGTVNLLLTGGTLVSAGFLVYFIATSGSHESTPVASARSNFGVVPLLSPNSAGLLLRGAL
ncbi:MAG: hypothetical protein ABW061_28000 [Polyangiaceae bacterium]